MERAEGVTSVLTRIVDTGLARLPVSPPGICPRYTCICRVRRNEDSWIGFWLLRIRMCSPSSSVKPRVRAWSRPSLLVSAEQPATSEAPSGILLPSTHHDGDRRRPSGPFQQGFLSPPPGLRPLSYVPASYLRNPREGNRSPPPGSILPLFLNLPHTVAPHPEVSDEKPIAQPPKPRLGLQRNKCLPWLYCRTNSILA